MSSFASPIASIIIPAHNEAAVIERTLDALLADARPGEFDVVVACNGCTDDTARRARRFGADVRVLEIEQPSKIAALNAGDAAAASSPRIYLDADVTLQAEDLRRTVAVLEVPGALAAAPSLHVDASASSWPVRAFYRVWLRRGYHRDNPLGAGVYALSADGRARFETFPAVIADDEYIRRLFRSDERRRVPDAQFTIRAPRRVRDLIKVKTRSRLGRYELRQRFPELFREEPVPRSENRVAWWPPARLAEQLAYGLIALATVWRARRQLPRLAQYAWERDETTRLPAATP